MQRSTRRQRAKVDPNDTDGYSSPLEGSKRRRTEKSLGTFACLAFILTGAVYFVMFPQNTTTKQISPTSIPTTVYTSKAVVNVTKDSATVECKILTENWKSEAALNGVVRITVQKNVETSSLFLYLVSEGYYNDVYIFRVIEGFVAQWGFHPDREMDLWREKIKIKRNEESSKKSQLHNVKGTLTMIHGSSPQVFFNLGDNRRLDKDGTIPLGFLDEESMNLVDKIYTGYKPGLGQIPSINNGTVSTLFPRMSKVEKCSLLE